MNAITLVGAAADDPNENAGVIHYPETGQSLRWMRHDGTVWLHFADLCKGTGHSNPSAAIHLIEDEDKHQFDVNEVFPGQAALRNLRAGTTSGNAEAWFVTEDGFITLGLAGRGDGPRMFRRWVVKVVIPQFRDAQRNMPAPVGANHDLDVIEQMITALRADRRRLAAMEVRQAEQANGQRVLQAKVSAIEGQHDWFTALGYAKLHDFPTNRPYLAKVGSKAGRLLRARGEQPVKRQDATFGSINTYPTDVLAEAFEAVAR